MKSNNAQDKLISMKNSSHRNVCLKWLLFACLICPALAFGQTLLSDYAANANFPIQERLTQEKILRISNTKRVIALSYANRGFLPGDYVTILQNDKHIARAVAAKTTEDSRAGLKIIKVYDLEAWNSLKMGMDVQVLRGDDSYYINRTAGDPNDPAQQEINRINSDDDLYNDTTFLEEDLEIEGNKKRKIKTDNIFSVNLGFIETVDLQGTSTSDVHYGFSYMYQIADNVWVEGGYGFTTLEGFPTTEVSTSLTTLTLRAKYVFATPFFSFTLPYVGYRLMSLDAPESETTDAINPEVQTQLLSQVEETGPVIGVTILKRLVPGWFARLDIGTDIINLGGSFEF